jgi:hypothetical protein
MKHGYYRKALESFCIIQPTPLLAARDLMYAHAQLEVESHLIERRKTSPQAVDELPDLGDRLRSSGIQHVQDGTVPVVDKEAGAREVGPQDNPYTYQFGVNGYWRRLSQLFSEPRCTRALLSAAVAMITQQITGVNTIGKRHKPTLKHPI